MLGAANCRWPALTLHCTREIEIQALVVATTIIDVEADANAADAGAGALWCGVVSRC